MASIIITGCDPTTGHLTFLPVNGNVNANRGEVVTWTINPQSGVSSILSISNKPNSPDIFSSDPSPVGGNSKNWQGTINSQLTVPACESYSINWVDNNGNSHPFDPIIQVNN